MKTDGTISFYDARKNYGIIIVKNSDNSVDRYFMLYTRIVSGKEPEVGDKVRFTTRPEKPKPGLLPAAYEIEVFVASELSAEVK